MQCKTHRACMLQSRVTGLWTRPKQWTVIITLPSLSSVPCCGCINAHLGNVAFDVAAIFSYIHYQGRLRAAGFCQLAHPSPLAAMLAKRRRINSPEDWADLVVETVLTQDWMTRHETLDQYLRCRSLKELLPKRLSPCQSKYGILTGEPTPRTIALPEYSPGRSEQLPPRTQKKLAATSCRMIGQGECHQGVGNMGAFPRIDVRGKSKKCLLCIMSKAYHVV